MYIYIYIYILPHIIPINCLQDASLVVLWPGLPLHPVLFFIAGLIWVPIKGLGFRGLYKANGNENGNCHYGFIAGLIWEVSQHEGYL